MLVFYLSYRIQKIKKEIIHRNPHLSFEMSISFFFFPYDWLNELLSFSVFNRCKF